MRPLLLALALSSLVACGGDVDATGDYTVNITYRDNGCGLANWTVGDTVSSIPLTIAQTDNAVTGTVGGAAGIALGIWLGDNHYTGTVSGSDLHLELEGQTNYAQGTCDYHYKSTIEGSLDNDLLSGKVNYTTVTDGAPDCGALQGCLSYQDFNGTRPPQ